MTKPASVKQLKDELNFRTKEEVLEFCLRLAKFKKENKELLTYLLFDSKDEDNFIQGVKREIESQFEALYSSNNYMTRKRVRKIQKEVKKYIRYSGKKETEVELLLFFCYQLKDLIPDYNWDPGLLNILNRQVSLIEKRLSSLHEDLQYDYEEDLQELLDL